MIVIMAGLPGTGKSTLARELAAHTRGVVLNKDEIRRALFGCGETEYSTQQDDFCMDVLLQTAGYLLHKNIDRVIFVDGRPFSKTVQLKQVLEVAAKLEQDVKILECTCEDAVARQRLEEQCSTHLAENRNYVLYLRLKSCWEPIMLPKTVIDTNHSLDDCVATAVQALQN